MVPTNREEHARSPHRSFKIKPDFGTLRIGICEPTIWKAWRKSGRINADAERFMVSWWLVLLMSVRESCLEDARLLFKLQGLVLCWV